MTRPLFLPHCDLVDRTSSRVLYMRQPSEKSYRKHLDPEEAERRWFAGLLWKAFPEARSEHELSKLVAEVLTTERRPVHPKTVRNWLRCENTPSFKYVMRVLALAGAESLFQIIDPENGQ